MTGQSEAALHPLLVDPQAGISFSAYPEVEYAFKHSLTRRSRESLLSVQRSLLHERTCRQSRRCSRTGSRSIAMSWHIITGRAGMCRRRLNT
ncbi:protein of unknown function (plasmid) [Cupriavidus taiwanensis]|uniref:Uncharacterized protein n=1 Tax=Cupriavidus taiwanensis TaxID=164546 RepID=A0A375HDC6_9BURK|nr:protein of unknown function [Cupriavidus taiwanensis]SPD48888.1 protein of unknown function [Cupriavidus taiwanensis]